jgi:hypothetical protein
MRARRGVLVDDKPGQQLPAGFTEIHLDRSKPAEDAAGAQGDTVTVSDLAQASAIIASLNI